MNTRLLAAALRIKAGDVRQADDERDADDNTLRDAVTLLRVLANVMDGMPPAKAFGPPGDWGYDTEIGRALAAAPEATTVVVSPQYQPRLTPVGAGDGNTLAVG